MWLCRYTTQLWRRQGGNVKKYRKFWIDSAGNCSYIGARWLGHVVPPDRPPNNCSSRARRYQEIAPDTSPEEKELSMSIQRKLLTVLLVLAGYGFAQDRGTIRGVVTDSSGATVPEATVTVKNVNTGLRQSVKTSTDGVYNVLYLPAGDYSVTTEKAGFRKAETSGVGVHVATVSNVDVTLAVGGVDQSVEVTAAAPLLDVQGTNLGKIIPKSAIRDLPLFISGGLRANLAFVVLTPGVIGASSNPRIGGGLLDGQSEQLDGAESNSERRNDPAMNGVSVEGMEEFKVQSSSYSAEYGRTSNGVINWVTKSGTNKIHGSMFVFNRNEVFNARGFTTAHSKL